MNYILFSNFLDERALVEGAKEFGYVVDSRTPACVEIIALGERQRYEILHVIEFTSARKRMSVLVRTPEGKIKVFCKGADSVIFERLIKKSQHDVVDDQDDFGNATLQHLEAFASEGLRTLCFAMANISESRYNVIRFKQNLK